VSGLAYGIDAAAHEGALAGGGPTLAVLASGLDRPTPAGNRRLAERILAAGGGWLSEHPPGTAALPHHFPERNRLISGLASVTLLVEARAASGTLWTARHALEQDRELMVVPGPIDDEHYRGSNRLLRDGAALVLESADLLLALGLAPRGAARGAGEQADPLLRALGEGPCDADRLARLLFLSPSVLSGRLLELELAGRIERRGNRISLSSQR
jgi:DNA processing protein